MDWNKFANQINANYKNNSDGFIGGDIILESIVKKDVNEKLRIQKKTRRTYEASSHFNVEKFNVFFSIKTPILERSELLKKISFNE